MTREKGMSIRLKLTLSYTAVAMCGGGIILVAAWVFLLRYVPDQAISANLFVPNRSDLLAEFGPAAWASMIGLFVCSAVGGWWLAGRVLAPLAAVTTAARRVGEGSLSHRANLPGRRDEIRELADTFDDMLDQIEAHVAEQQRFAANASHELRTPLAISKTLLEVAKSDPSVNVDILIARLSDVNDRAVALTEALLMLSRSGKALSEAELEPIDLSLTAEQVVEDLLPLAERHRVSLRFSVSQVGVEGADAPPRITGSPVLVSQLVTNLVQNAIVHNLPAEEHGWVRVTVGCDADGSTVLEVSNSGPIVDPASVTSLLEPFYRGSGRVAGTGDSAESKRMGLGLAIVDRIVKSHHGALTITPALAGGFTVLVRL